MIDDIKKKKSPWDEKGDIYIYVEDELYNIKINFWCQKNYNTNSFKKQHTRTIYLSTSRDILLILSSEISGWRWIQLSTYGRQPISVSLI